MKCFFAFVFVLYFGTAIAGVRYPTADEVANSNLMVKRFINEFEQKLNDVKKENWSDEEMEFFAGALNLPQDAAKNLIVAFLAEQQIGEWLEQLRIQMEEQGKRLGREVKTSKRESDREMVVEYWLDRGDMDSEKCQMDFDKKQACDYPAGFEEFLIKYSVYDINDLEKWNTALDIHIDDKEQNKTNVISIYLNSSDTRTDDNLTFDLSFDLSGNEYNYNEWHEFRNNSAADVRNGMMVRAGPGEKKSDSNSPFGDIEWKMDTSRKWKSQQIPDWIVFSKIFTKFSVTWF